MLQQTTKGSAMLLWQGHNAVMTRDDHPTGTDRLAEVSTKVDDIYINVQAMSH